MKCCSQIWCGQHIEEITKALAFGKINRPVGIDCDIPIRRYPRRHPRRHPAGTRHAVWPHFIAYNDNVLKIRSGMFLMTIMIAAHQPGR
jgi:hypothetical protein